MEGTFEAFALPKDELVYQQLLLATPAVTFASFLFLRKQVIGVKVVINYISQDTGGQFPYVREASYRPVITRVMRTFIGIFHNEKGTTLSHPGRNGARLNALSN